MSSLLKNVPDAWGPKFEGDDCAVTPTRTGPNEISFTAGSHMALVMFTPQPNREMALNSDRKSRFLAPAGAIEIVPAHADLYARWPTRKENILVALRPERLGRLAGLDFDDADFEFRPARAGFVDERAHMLAGMMREEFENDDSINELYMDSLITVFSVHLLRTHSSFRDRSLPVFRGGLSARIWKRVDDYIHARLSDRLLIGDLALVAGLSPSHFMRAFRETVGQSPHQYVLALRLAHAERMIATTDVPLAEIASRTGFASHSHMSSAMRRLRSTTPMKLRREMLTSAAGIDPSGHPLETVDAIASVIRQPPR